MKLSTRYDSALAPAGAGYGAANRAGATAGRDGVQFREALAGGAVSGASSALRDDVAMVDADGRLLVHRRGANLTGYRRLQGSGMKRLIDIVGAGVGLLFLAPLLLVTALLVLLDGPGPVIFKQRRTGQAGKIFWIYKFRTMSVTEDGAQVVQARRGDPRVTRIGRFLRRSSIDELPQLFNVLKGDMSLVGPRPHALVHDEVYGERISGYRNRFLAKPGITGLSQVRGLRGATPTDECMRTRLETDMEYIRSWSLKLDIQILLKTLFVSVWDSSAF
jgi:exopolysaccharide biosynthesis polyprenyl glycosylphosphotransferase